jgi:hypothetical protein
MTRSFRSIVLIMQYMFHCLPTYELHISLLEVGWEREGIMLLYYQKYHIFWEERKGIHHNCLGEDPEIPQRRDLKGSYIEISEFYFENIAKLRNNSWSKSLKHGAWLDRSVFQLLKTQVTVTSLMVEGNMSEFFIKIVHSNPEESSCLNACVPIRRESIIATPDPSLSLSLLRDEQKAWGSLLTVDKYHF